MTGLFGDERANGSAVVVTIAALLLVALAGALVLSTGTDTPGAGTPDGGTTTATPTGGDDPRDSGGSGGSGGGSGSASEGGSSTNTSTPPYDFDVLRTESCGNTCRDVTVQLTNNRDARADDVAVTTRIYAGNTTEENARVWEGRREVGTLEPGGSTTKTQRVSLSYFEALSIQRKGGWTTIVTTVESEAVTRTFEERRKVT